MVNLKVKENCTGQIYIIFKQTFLNYQPELYSDLFFNTNVTLVSS